MERPSNMESKVVPSEGEYGVGCICKIGKNEMVVQTGKDCLSLEEVQLEGKKRMDVGSFLRGYESRGWNILSVLGGYFDKFGEFTSSCFRNACGDCENKQYSHLLLRAVLEISVLRKAGTCFYYILQKERLNI